MWYIITFLFGVTAGVIGMGLMSGQAYEKGYEDAMNDLMVEEVTKHG